MFRQTFGGLVSKWRIGETGYYICADKAFSIVSPCRAIPRCSTRTFWTLG